MDDTSKQHNLHSKNRIEQFWIWLVMLPAVTLCGCGITANGWNAEGVKLYEAGHLTQAIERFQYALGTNDQNSDAYYNLAVTYHQAVSYTHLTLPTKA